MRKKGAPTQGLVVPKEQADYWMLFSELQTIKSHYNLDFDNRCPELESYLYDVEKRKENNLDISTEEMEAETKKFWKRLLSEAAGQLMETIERRKTRGQLFSNELKTLKELRDGLDYKNFDLKTLEEFYRSLVSIRDNIKERLELEAYETKRYWYGIVISAILGAIFGFLLGLAVTYIHL